MKKMQWLNLKILLVGLILFFPLRVCFSQTTSFRLNRADSLFDTKLYTQSFEQYHAITLQKEYTPAMLLRMAYIQEGLKHTGQALYYLNLYYLASNDKLVLQKMEELADKNNLEGYRTSESEKILSFYHSYYFNITVALAALSMVVMGLMVYSKKKNHKPFAWGVAMSVILVGLFVHQNVGERIFKGIIANDNTYVMEGPSAGAAVKEIISDGHRVEIMGEKDVWMKVLWNGEEAYIKQENILPVQL